MSCLVLRVDFVVLLERVILFPLTGFFLKYSTCKEFVCFAGWSVKVFRSRLWGSSPEAATHKSQTRTPQKGEERS